MRKIEGLHHVTCVTNNIHRNLWFYATLLGLDVLKKSVKHDDIFAYHLTYGNKHTSQRNCITFFENPSHNNHVVANGCTLIGFRVLTTLSLQFWQQRLSQSGVVIEPMTFQYGKWGFNCVDPDGINLRLIADVDVQLGENTLKTTSLIPVEHTIIGLGEIHLQVHNPTAIDHWLTQVLQLQRSTIANSVSLYHIPLEGCHSRMIVRLSDPLQAHSYQSKIHHIAWRVQDITTLTQLHSAFLSLNFATSDVIDRTSYHSVYVRDHHHLLFEFTTDTLHFMSDENSDVLNERLSLPPFLEPYRTIIEKRLKPL